MIAGSGRLKTARTAANIDAVQELSSSQKEPEYQRGHCSQREASRHLNISRSSLQRIQHDDLGMKSFRRIPVQLLSEGQKERRHERAMNWLEHYADTEHTIFSDEKMWLAHPPMNGGNDRFWTDTLKRDSGTEQIIRPVARYGPAVSH